MFWRRKTLELNDYGAAINRFVALFERASPVGQQAMMEKDVSKLLMMINETKRELELLEEELTHARPSRKELMDSHKYLVKGIRANILEMGASRSGAKTRTVLYADLCAENLEQAFQEMRNIRDHDGEIFIQLSLNSQARAWVNLVSDDKSSS